MIQHRFVRSFRKSIGCKATRAIGATNAVRESAKKATIARASYSTIKSPTYASSSESSIHHVQASRTMSAAGSFSGYESP